MKYHARADAPAVVREKRGVKVSESTLRTLASRGTGPKFAIINGRACYTEEDLLAWVDNQAAQPPRKRPRAAAAGAP